MTVIINGTDLKIADVVKIARGRAGVEIDKKAKLRVDASRKTVADIVSSKRVVYGINTGFGKFADVAISDTDTAL